MLECHRWQVGEIQVWRAGFLLQMMHQAMRGIALDLGSIADNVQASRRDQANQQNDPQPGPGEERYFRNGLSQSNVKGIQNPCGEAAGCSQRDHGSSGQGIEAKRSGNGDADRDKHHDFCRHPHSEAGYREEGNEDRNHPFSLIGEPAGYPARDGFNRASGRNNLKSTADNQNEEDYVCGIDQSVDDSLRQANQSDGAGFHRLIGVRNDQGLAGNFILDSFKFP